MQYWTTDLGQQKRGTVVEVTLKGDAANVQLMNSSALSSYKKGRRYRAVGGHAKKSPVRLQVPSSGHWYVVVDHGGLKGKTRYGVEVLPGALPPIRQRRAPSVSSIAQNAAEYDDAETATVEFDVFISHATEDKEDLVRPLAHALQDRDLKVWYDEFELVLGDSLRRKIDEGVGNSRFGIVVLSPDFFAKNWPQYELDGLVTREMNGEQVILPLWHRISKQEVIAQSASLADKVALRTSDLTVDEIAGQVADAIAARDASQPTG